MVEKASSPFSEADITAYYEACAYMSSNDRELIIGMGFQEWLLAAINGRVQSAAPSHRRGVRASLPEQQEIDIVILMANLIGGAIDGTD